MKTIVRTVLILLGGLLIVTGVVILAANLYIQSEPTQLKIESKLSQTLRMPLEIQRTSLTPWGGLNITGIAVPQSPPTKRQSHFLEAQECCIQFRLWPILLRKLVIDQILVKQPSVIWIQNPTGRWTFPEADPQEAPATLGSVDSSGLSVPLSPSQAPARSKPFEIVMSRVNIRNGTFNFTNPSGRRIVLFTGVNVEVPHAHSDLFEGATTCEKISFYDLLFADTFKTHFSYSSERLVLSDLSAQIASGRVVGELVIKTSESKSPYSADLKFSKVDLNRLVAEAGGPSNQAGGELSGFLDIYGDVSDLHSMTGSGQWVLNNGQIHQFKLLQMLGTILQIEELSQLNLQKASASIRIENGTLLLDSLVLQSDNLRISAQGVVEFAGRLDLSATLVINQKISRQLPDFIQANFQRMPDSDLRTLDFKIFGTATQPRTDLGTRILGRDIEKKVEKRAVEFLHNIFGGKKRKPNPPPTSPNNP